MSTCDPKSGSIRDALSSLSPEGRKAAYEKHLLVSTRISVFQEPPSQLIEYFVPGKPIAWPGPLLKMCREVDPDEADTVFYGRNHFYLVDTSIDREVAILDAFLASITPRCARELRHMSLSFPLLEKIGVQSRALGVQEAGVRSLRLLQMKCENLTTLELSVHIGNAFGLSKESVHDPQSLQKACSQIAGHFGEIKTLDRIIVRYHHDKPPSSVRLLMEDLGWIVLLDKEQALR